MDYGYFYRTAMPKSDTGQDARFVIWSNGEVIG